MYIPKKGGLVARKSNKQIMKTLTLSTNNQQVKSQDYYDGEFDAAMATPAEGIALPPKSYYGEYWRGYLAKVIETGNTPF